VLGYKDFYKLHRGGFTEKLQRKELFKKKPQETSFKGVVLGLNKHPSLNTSRVIARQYLATGKMLVLGHKGDLA